MSWSEGSKDRFYDAVLDAVSQGATPEEMLNELEQGYYMALDSFKKSASFSFGMLLKRG
jgi:hypothetical protein